MSFQQYPNTLYRRTTRRPSFLFGLVVFLCGFCFTLVSLNIYNPSLVPKNLRVLSLDKKINIVFLGCDEGSALWKGRSDTIILVSCNPYENTLNILNIPRDTKIKIPGRGIEKINFLNSVGGPMFTKECIEKLLGIHIDHYVIVNLQELNKIIDEVGGVVINVPQRMYYEDHAAMLKINLFSGKQILNGEQAIGFVRYRHDSLGDIGRIQRQQEFMRAVFRKLMDPVTFTKLPDIVSLYKRTILTDLEPHEMIRIANFTRNIPAKNQKIVILPGDFSTRSTAGYWIPNQKEINKVVKNLFYEDHTLDKSHKYKRINTKDIKVSIFNGSHKDPSLIKKLVEKLKKYGYTILFTQDFEEHIITSKIYAQRANPEVALQVKHDIGNLGELLIGNLGPPEADVTILAGDDLVNLMVKEKD